MVESSSGSLLAGAGVAVAIVDEVLLERVDQVCGARFPVALRRLAGKFLGQFQAFFAGMLALVTLAVALVDVHQRGLPPGGVVERLGGFGWLGMLMGIFSG